jgi:S1-C subfamily serine protease
VRVTRVIAGSPAGVAGVRVGDVLTSVDGTRLAADRVDVKAILADCVGQMKPGDLIALVLHRAGERTRVVVKLEEKPLAADEAKRAENAAFGVAARDLVADDRVALRLDESFTGARMTGVRPTGFAGIGGLCVDDVVVEVDDAAVADATDLCARLDQAARERREQLVLFVRRGRDTVFVHVRPDWTR